MYNPRKERGVRGVANLQLGAAEKGQQGAVIRTPLTSYDPNKLYTILNTLK